MQISDLASNGSSSFIYRIFSKRTSETENHLNRYIDQVLTSHEERMRWTENVSTDDQPSFEQLSLRSIDDELTGALSAIKGLERVLDERVRISESYGTSLIRLRPLAESLRHINGSLRNSVDQMFCYLDVEIQQNQRSLELKDMKKLLHNMRVEALSRMEEYQRQISNSRKDMQLHEKRLSKLKEQIQSNSKDKSSDTKRRWRDQLSELFQTGNASPTSAKDTEAHTISPYDSFSASVQGLVSPVGSPELTRKTSSDSGLVNVLGEADSVEDVSTSGMDEREKMEIVQALMRAISNNDQIALASRRAYQSLLYECKSSVCGVLRQMARTEREVLQNRLEALDRFEASVESLNLDRDIAEFIEKNISQTDCVELQESALRMFETFLMTQHEKAAASVAEQKLPEGNDSPSRTRRLSVDKHRQQVEEWLQVLLRDDSQEIVVQVVGESHPREYLLQGAADFKNEAFMGLTTAIVTDEGRAVLCSVLSQLRGKADVTTSYDLLGAVLWKSLDACVSMNDVHTAKIVMMLSQTFYKTEHESRVFVKEFLHSHPLWSELGFWEHALWECVRDQFDTLPALVPWYDCTLPERQEMVARIHNITFSQVMAIAHSMMELGCSLGICSSFVERMCVLHQLTEGQRQMLLLHLSLSKT